MNEAALNMSIRKFLKQFGITGQREIEHAVAAALESGQLKGGESLEASAVLTVAGLGELAIVKGTLTLD